MVIETPGGDVITLVGDLRGYGQQTYVPVTITSRINDFFNITTTDGERITIFIESHTYVSSKLDEERAN